MARTKFIPRFTELYGDMDLKDLKQFQNEISREVSKKGKAEKAKSDDIASSIFKNFKLGKDVVFTTKEGSTETGICDGIIASKKKIYVTVGDKSMSVPMKRVVSLAGAAIRKED